MVVSQSIQVQKYANLRTNANNALARSGLLMVEKRLPSASRRVSRRGQCVFYVEKKENLGEIV